MNHRHVETPPDESFDEDYEEEYVEHEDFIEEGHQMAHPDELEEHEVLISYRHILAFLGGLTVAGLIIFAGWEFVRHTLQKRRMESVTGNIADIFVAGADVMHEVRMMGGPAELDSFGDETRGALPEEEVPLGLPGRNEPDPEEGVDGALDAS
jgi:hypothetical protein